MSGGRKSIRVLIVDDDPTMRTLVRRAATQMRMEPWMVSSLAEAKDEILAGQRPDLVITDLMLGDGTGVDLVRFLRRAAIPAPAVLVTGTAEALSLAERGLFVDVVQKPFRLSALFDALDVARRNVRPRHRSDVLQRPGSADAAANENTKVATPRASGEDEDR